MKNYLAEPLVARHRNSSLSKSGVDDVIGGDDSLGVLPSSVYFADRSRALLDKQQVQRLLDVLDEEFEVHGRGNFPTLNIQPGRLIRLLAARVQTKNLSIKRVKMNGRAASYVIGGQQLEKCDRNGNLDKNLRQQDDCETPVDDRFSDLDLIFDVDLEPTDNFDLFKQCTMESLIEFLPELANRSKITHSVMQEAYVKKMVKIVGNSPYHYAGGAKRAPNQRHTSGDLWSLITLNNDHGRCIELKFVDRMRRQFEFSVDSFQIHLDRLLFLRTTTNETVMTSLRRDDGVIAMVTSPRRDDDVIAMVTSSRRDDDVADKATELRRLSAAAVSDRCEIESGDRCEIKSDDDRCEIYSGDRRVIKSKDRCEIKLGDQREVNCNDRCEIHSSDCCEICDVESLDDDEEMVVVAESAYGDFRAASEHLRRKLIATTQPELIRGGGLLKYVHLLVKGFRPLDDDLDATESSYNGEAVRKLERYMCSRFFIDFGRLDQQERKLRAYLDDHLRLYSLQAKCNFLVLLYRVIDESTVCLMNHERHQTLNLLCRLMSEIESSPPVAQPAVVVTSSSYSSFHGAAATPPPRYCQRQNFYATATPPPPSNENAAATLYAFHHHAPSAASAAAGHVTFVSANPIVVEAVELRRHRPADVGGGNAGAGGAATAFFYVPRQQSSQQQQSATTFWIPVPVV